MKVSVLINNYNYGRFLDDCLLSLKNQTVKADEVILYDDGSSDNSIEIASKYDFVKIISNANFGQKPAFNQANGIYQAFLESSGDIICLLDSDDFFHEKKIEIIINAYRQNKHAVLIQHAYFEWVNGEVTRVLNFGKKNIDYKKLYKRTKWTGFFNTTSNFAFTRDYLDNVLPIDVDCNWRVWPDVRLSRLAPYYGEVISLDEALTYYRKHGDNDSSMMNFDHKKTLINQIAHHDYVNSKLKVLSEEPIMYKMSFNYLKFYLKANLLERLLIMVKKET